MESHASEEYMESVMDNTIGSGRVAAQREVRSGAQLPLSMVNEGETACVARVRGKQELRQHLAEMGFVQGASVQVVSRVSGDVVVKVKGATFALNRDIAMRIVTC
jgi:ferrous iron transport protein A